MEKLGALGVGSTTASSSLIDVNRLNYGLLELKDQVIYVNVERVDLRYGPSGRGLSPLSTFYNSEEIIILSRKARCEFPLGVKLWVIRLIGCGAEA